MTYPSPLLLDRLRQMCADGTAAATRKDTRVSLRALSRWVDVPASTLHRWERGEHAPHGDGAYRYGLFLLQAADGDVTGGELLP